jgi:hypothetical protein
MVNFIFEIIDEVKNGEKRYENFTIIGEIMNYDLTKENENENFLYVHLMQNSNFLLREYPAIN